MAFYPPIYNRNFYGMQMQNQQFPMQNQPMPDFVPTYQQPQPSNDMLWVLNEAEATAYNVAPNNSVVLWDKNNPTIYIKSVNMQGVPSMRVLDFTERTADAQKQPLKHECDCANKFAPIDSFNRLQQEFDAFIERYEKETAKAKTAKKVKEEE